jgi:D-amino-acid dehydrogenase
MSTKRITVIGGGIIGVCAALALQRDGHQVTLVDRKKPERETSYGNAGVLSESSIMVLNNPGLLKSLPRLLLHLSEGFRYSPLFLVKKLRWALRFISYCNDDHMKRSARAPRQLQVFSLQAHK